MKLKKNKKGKYVVNILQKKTTWFLIFSVSVLVMYLINILLNALNIFKEFDTIFNYYFIFVNLLSLSFIIIEFFKYKNKSIKHYFKIKKLEKQIRKAMLNTMLTNQMKDEENVIEIPDIKCDFSKFDGEDIIEVFVEIIPGLVAEQEELGKEISKSTNKIRSLKKYSVVDFYETNALTEFYFLLKNRSENNRLIINDIDELETQEDGIIIQKNLVWNYTKSTEAHCLIVGNTGSGKSTFAEFILFQIIKQGYQFLIIDPKRHFIDDETGLKILKSRVVSDSKKFLSTFETLLNIMEKREKQNKKNLKPLFVFIDEYISVTKSDKKISSILETLLSRSRSSKIYFIAMIQYSSSKQIDTSTRSNFAFNIALSSDRKLKGEISKMLFDEVYNLSNIDSYSGFYKLGARNTIPQEIFISDIRKLDKSKIEKLFKSNYLKKQIPPNISPVVPKKTHRRGTV